ncbi:MAG: hypothetical protein ACRDTV_16515, partial [Mycobacterium sp.]
MTADLAEVTRLTRLPHLGVVAWRARLSPAPIRANLLAKEAAMLAERPAQFNIHDAKTNLSRIIERVERGE